MRTLLALVLLAAAGCGPGTQTFSVGSSQIVVHDQLYESKPMGYYCDALAAGQVIIRLTDYAPACYLDQMGGDPYDQSQGHTELDIVLAINTHANDLRDPYTVSKVDCAIGPGDNGTAFFYHFPPGDKTKVRPDQMIQVDSGSVKLDQYDPSNMKPIKGRFELTFGSDKLSGTLDALNCDKQ